MILVYGLVYRERVLPVVKARDEVRPLFLLPEPDADPAAQVVYEAKGYPVLLRKAPLKGQVARDLGFACLLPLD